MKIEKKPESDQEKGIRLQVHLARAGLASRRKAEDLIRAGRVRVNGVVAAELGMRVRPGRDRVEVDGAEAGAEPKRYILLNKPAGFICSLSDGYGRKLVTELLEGVPERLVLQPAHPSPAPGAQGLPGPPARSGHAPADREAGGGGGHRGRAPDFPGAG